MSAYDCVVSGAQVAGPDGLKQLDIGITDGRIAALAPSVPGGKQRIDAAGLWALPGGIDSHCHVEQLSGMGVMCADDFYSATVSAAFGGTTTIIPFAAQHRGNAIPDVIADYAKRAAEKAVIDYGFHLILADPTEQALNTDIPNAVREGITSFKVYMTYDRLKLDDGQLLDVMSLAAREGAMVMVHAENNDMIRFLAARLLKNGFIAPKYHAVAHDPLAEEEATNRIIALSKLLGVPVLIVHVSGTTAIRIIRAARAEGAPVHAESCPQYLFLTAEDIDKPGLDGAMFCCSPPPRDAFAQAAVWQGLLDGTIGVYSSDHAPYRFDESGKLPKGDKTTFKDMANGVPGLELRLPLLFSEGVIGGKMSIGDFVALTATNHARMYGLEGRKGVIAKGYDADIALWDPQKKTTISTALLHDNVGYTPYEGRTLTGWPVTVLSRGRVVVADGELKASRGSGQFLKRGRSLALDDERAKAARASRSFLHDLIGE